MSKKRRYRAIPVNDRGIRTLVTSCAHKRVTVGIDIAKTRQFATIVADGEPQGTVRWEHPVESPAFIRLLEELSEVSAGVETVMEPSGTYGDALRAKLAEAGFAVYRVNPKRSHDAAEVYDGVPSLHDAKSAAVVAKLHLDGASEPWPVANHQERALSAALRVLEIYQKQFQQNRNRLEALLARHWPELPRVLELDSATLLELLVKYPSPQDVTQHRAEAEALMRRVGGRFLSPEKIATVLEQAARSFGLEPTAEERRTLRAIAAEARRCQQAAGSEKRRVEKLSTKEPSAHRMGQVIGKTTAAVLVAAVGSPGRYESSAAFEKALGLNLKEKSSGKHQGPLRITKRGPGVARLFLYLAALRMVSREPVTRAWYAKKVARQGGTAKSKAVVAVMRKLVRSMWHVARGENFDPHKLFDVSRLSLEPEVAGAT